MNIRQRIGLEFLCDLGANPVDFARLAGEAGARSISILPEQLDYNPLGYPHWSLLKDTKLRRTLRETLSNQDVSIGLGEGIAVLPGRDIAEFEPVIDLFCELGVRCVNIVSTDPDWSRTLDQFAFIAERIDAAGLDLVLEFAPILTVKTIDQALDAIGHIGITGTRLLIDVMHFTRAGHSPELLDSLDADLIGYVQICDGPLRHDPDYMAEAMNERMLPGNGEMPVREIMQRVPKDVVVSAEVPQLTLAQSGVPAEQRFKAIVERVSDFV